ncbi:single-stranded DNA-binding protein [Campylobacter upsaliensis]|nr:single-stranded DNA-binding protein [Campylobacter upsaliensis]EHZ4355171.1 single-stranded DNA-binding protein [Campylobacter jejuni]EAI5357690.1 single-stranded DNA-binding protein [Campylobacter upsaliensis]EAJ2870933.1 single-stranded DNA-binding protein [Campylobacter upsaliensis]EAJ3013182.1 single-stranded DNA-binding protein [Campylobacter upsaliensis]
MNNVNLIGYLGKDFEVGNTSGGKLYAKNSLAITKRWKNEKGNDESSTTWIPIVLFGKSAESASIYIKKGSQFACSGELSSSQYTDEQGNVKTTLSVIVSKFYWLGKKDKETPQEIQNPPKEPSVEYEHQAINVESEEIPF